MPDEKSKTITVQGRSKISCKPDTIGIAFKLSSKNDSYSIAYDTLNKQVTLLRNNLEKLNLKKDQIKTSAFNISTESKREDEEYVFDGYLASHQLRIETAIDKEMVNNILNTIVRSGSVSNISIYFLVSKTDSYKDQAISTAVEKAKHNAEIITKAANVKLGPLMHINYGWSEVVFRNEPANMVCEERSEYSEAPDIEPGDIDIEESVTMVYSIA